MKPRDAVSPACAAALLLLGAYGYLILHGPALYGWFIREDARFFGPGPFSLVDLFTAFATPADTAGHYRPIGRFLWWVPRFFGTDDAKAYHLLSLSLLAATAFAFWRLHRLIFAERISAAAATGLFVFSQVHAKPMYWASAWHNTTVILFVLLAACARIEMWRSERRRGIYRGLSIFCAFLAIASRETGFTFVPLLLLIDWLWGRNLRRAWDFLALAAFFLVFLFVWNNPFRVLNWQPDSAGEGPFSRFWNYLVYCFGGHLEWVDGNSPWPYLVLAGLTLVFAVVAPLRDRRALLGSILLFVGISPMLTTPMVNPEYAGLMCAGAALLVSAPIAWALRRFAFPALHAATGLTLLTALFFHLEHLRPSGAWYAEEYAEVSRTMRLFIHELAVYSRTLPPARPIWITDFGPYRDSRARSTHNFLVRGLDQVIPEHFYIFSGRELSLLEGTDLHNQDGRHWTMLHFAEPPFLPIRFTERGFERAHD